MNPDIIRRCSAEASILAQIARGTEDNGEGSVNVVKIYGVSVLPPSVCIVLEICYYGSLSDVIRGVHYPPVVEMPYNGSVALSTDNSVTAGLLNAVAVAFPSRSSFTSRVGSRTSMSVDSSDADDALYGFSQLRGAMYDGGKRYAGTPTRPPLNLSLSDKYFLALGMSMRLYRKFVMPCDNVVYNT